MTTPAATVPRQAAPAKTAPRKAAPAKTAPAAKAPATTAGAGTVSTTPLVAFWVSIDGLALPSFTECSGLSVEREAIPWVEAGNNDFTHQLPGKATYGAVTLTRAVDSSSGAIAAWFSSVLDQTTLFKTATILACDPAGTTLCHWDLVGVWPRQWTGPTFSASGTTAATESLELVHHGFTFTFGKGAP